MKIFHLHSEEELKELEQEEEEEQEEEIEEQEKTYDQTGWDQIRLNEFLPNPAGTDQPLEIHGIDFTLGEFIEIINPFS